MADSDQDKSELPSQFKLQRARREGSVARGMDLGFLVALVVSLLFMSMAGPRFAASLAHSMGTTLLAGAAADDGPALATIAARATGAVLPFVAMFCVALFATIMLFEVVQTGIVFSAKPLKPDFTRLNPATGIKRLFSMKMMLETVKNVLKLIAYGGVAYLVIEGAARARAGAVVDGPSLLDFMRHLAGRLLMVFVLVAMLFAVVDQLLARRMFLRQMRMSRREMKREVRDREGDGRLKQKRKQLHGEFVRTSQSLQGLKGADVLVTNPQHIAVALRYRGATMAAPQIVSIGLNGVALRLKRLATLHGIDIVENRPLARALLKGGTLGRPVPDDLFGPVAEVYNALRRNGRWRPELR